MNIPLMDKEVTHMYTHMNFNIKDNICMREKIIKNATTV